MEIETGSGGFTASTHTKTQIDFCSNGYYRYQSVQVKESKGSEWL
jgi:hypothetical protein